jgi:hypothetical protein
MFKQICLALLLFVLADNTLFAQSNSERLKENKNPFGRKRERSKTAGKVFRKRGKTKQFGDISSFVKHRTRATSGFWSKLFFWRYSKTTKKSSNYSYGKMKRRELKGLFKRQRTGGKWFKERSLKKLNRQRQRYRRKHNY